MDVPVKALLTPDEMWQSRRQGDATVDPRARSRIHDRTDSINVKGRSLLRLGGRSPSATGSGRRSLKAVRQGADRSDARSYHASASERHLVARQAGTTTGRASKPQLNATRWQYDRRHQGWQRLQLAWAEQKYEV